MSWPISSATAIAVLISSSAALSQPDSPVPPAQVVSHNDSSDIEYFRPLAPELSDYWKGTFPQIKNYGDIPLPPLPLAKSIYPAFGDELPEFMGSAISTDPLFWKGVYVANTSPEEWEFYTLLDPDSGVETWHNYFQSAIEIANSNYPPSWPTSGPASTNFSDWVDLYAPYLSRAYFDDYSGFETDTYSDFDASHGFGRYGFPRVGSPQHVDLPPTYPPQTLDVWASTSPLVPASDATTVGSYTTRQTVAGRLDLITGEPLLQEPDLELPFGSAVFRRLRTYSESADHGIKAHNHKHFGSDIETWTRGWHGSGWMSSDMPLFYFDASQAGTITTGQSEQIGPVCYFVPDAHHAIPFVQHSRSSEGADVPPDYIAPDWFDAMLLYDKSECEWGVLNPGEPVERSGWITPPEEVKVYLQNRSVIYTIKLYYEDVDPVQHRRPEIDNHGKYTTNFEINYGVPYYGLVTSIQDKSGNLVSIQYVDSEKHKPYWDPNTDIRNKAASEDKIPVRQKGWYKGMIDHIKLYPAGESIAKWSIFYTYRAFYSERDRSESFFRLDDLDKLEEFVNYFDHLSHPPALHSLMVYERDVAESEIASARELILPCDTTTYGPAEHVAQGATPPAFVDLLVDRSGTDTDSDGVNDVVRVFSKPATGTHNNQFDHQDVTIGPTGEGESTVTVMPTDWTHQVRFSYADPVYYGEYDDDGTYTDGEFNPIQDYTLRSCGPVKITANYWVWQRARAAYLLKTAVHSRAEADVGAMQDLPPQFWLYRYQDVEGAGPDTPDPYPAYNGYRYWSYGTLGVALPRRMSHRYGPDTIGRIYRNRPTESETCDFNSFVNGLIGLDEDRYVEGQLCFMSPPDPPGGSGGPTINPEPGGSFGYDDSASPYQDPGDPDAGQLNTSSTQSAEEEDTNNLPIGLLADTIFYRWSEPYRLDPRLLSEDPGTTGDPELIARPASWALYDGRFDSAVVASDFNIDLRDNFVGGSISDACEQILDDLTITQANQQTTGFLPGGSGVYSTLAADGTVKWYRMYRFITAPDEPTAWRGSLYGTEGRNINVPLGPEVIWDMQEYPDSNYGDDPSAIPNNVNATHAIYYYPFNFVAVEWGGNIDDAEAINIEQSKPMWWVVVDEYESIEEALSVNSSMAYPEDDINDYIYAEYDTQAPWSNRRVVGLNSTGAVLSDRTWTNDSGTVATDDPPAVMEAWSYDEHLRPILKFSRGWGAAAASTVDETTNGLVEVFEYDAPFDVNMGSPGHGADDVIITLAPRTPLNKWIRKGCTPGNDLRISSIEYYTDPFGSGLEPQEWRAKLPKKQSFYDLLGVEIGAIEHFYGHWDLADLPDPDPNDNESVESAQPPMRWKVRAGPQHQRSPGGALVRAIDGQWYNNKGEMVWSISGAMENPVPDAQGHLSISPADEVFLNYSQFDEDGREILRVEDISIDSAGQGFTELHLTHPGHPTDAAYGDGSNPTQPYWQTLTGTPEGTLFVGDDVPADDVTAAELQSMLGRIASDQSQLIGTGMFREADAEPLNHVTFRAYNNFGPFKVVHPNGLRDMFHYEVESAWLRELRAQGIDYENDNWRWVGQSLYDSEFEGQAFTDGIQAAIDELEGGAWSGSPYDLESDVFESNRLEVIAELTPNYDTAGRLTSLTVADTSESAEPIKSAVSYDGWGNTLLEITPDRLITRHKYDGLGRLHKTFVGSSDRHFRWRTATQQDEDDDLILTEKLYYGNSPTDASLPIKKWMFRERSSLQYEDSEWFEPSDDQYGTGPAFATGDSDDDKSSPGRIEHYGYDWRMRRVITMHEDFESGNPGVYREERSFLDNLDRVRFVAAYSPVATAGAPSPDIAPGSDLPSASAFLGTGPSANLLSLDETVYNEAGQVIERRRYDPTGAGGYLVTHSYTDHADRALWASSSSGRVTKNVYDAKGRLVAASVFAGDGAGAIEMTRTENVYGPDGNIEQAHFFERSTDATGAPDLDNAAHRLSVTYTWFDSSSRVVAVADMGSATFNGSAYDRTIPLRPDESPEKLEKVASYVSASSTSQRRLLVGVEYPDAFFDSVTGDSLARITCNWYDRSGKQNAVLNVISASKDIGTGDKTIEYTIDRTEHNRYGQKVLEHKYGYTGDGSSYLQGDFELLGGMEYSYEAEMVLEGQSTPSVVTTTQVRTITPLTTDSTMMSIAWEDDDSDRTVDSTTGEVTYTISGAGRFATTWHNTSEKRTTYLEYGAPIVQPNFDLPSYVLHPNGPVSLPIDSNDWGYLGISNRPDLVKAVHLPNPNTGGTGDGMGYSMFFFYYADGLPAIRVDSRGIGIQYIYDSDGNLTRLSSDDANMPLVDDLGMIDDQLPSNAIEYTYDALNRLLSVKTGRDYSDGSGTFRVDTESLLQYDPLGNLLSEQQDRFNVDGTLAAGGTVAYAWDTKLRQSNADPVDHTNNVNRLLSITYPDRVGTHDGGGHSARVVTLGYGTAGGISDQLDRAESLTSTGGPVGKELGHVATYRYDGLNRLAGVDLGSVPGQPTGTFVHTDDRQFDLFGRVVDREVKSFDDVSGSHVTVMHSEFGYDLRGQRLYESLSQLDQPQLGSRDNTHSWFYEYDRLGRLVGEHHGTLKSNGFEGIDHAASLIEPLRQLYGLDSLNRRIGTATAPGISIWEDANKDGAVDVGELLEQTHVLDERGGLTGLDDGSSTEAVAQDLSGAITELHGREIYHDWLGRPVLALDDSGDAVFSVSYDGFGRVAQRRAPWPQSDPALLLQRAETYFYDGVRRIQEVFDDPKPAIPPWPVAVPLGGGFGGGNSGPEQRTEAEYIWSAAGGQPFDTCHVQIDWWDREAWSIQDHQTGTVRAYTDETGEMARQYRFDAFGKLTSMDEFPLAKSGGLMKTFHNRIGHQGLFAERVDSHTRAKVFSPQSSVELWYQSRSRWYVPELGRFMTPDPNATGIPTVTSLAMLGRMPAGPPSGGFDWADHYGDGWDVNTAYGGNPVMHQDPNGLFFSLGGLLGGTGAGQVGNTYNSSVAEGGMNAMGGLTMISNGVGVQQAMMLMMIDSMMGAIAPGAFDVALRGISRVASGIRNGFSKLTGIGRRGNNFLSPGQSRVWTPLDANNPVVSDPRLNNAFRSNTFTERVTSAPTTLYRVHGGEAGELGRWWTTTKPRGSGQAINDLALDPKWGNTAQHVTTIRAPAGTHMYEGVAGSQRHLHGGGMQVYLPSGPRSDWIIGRGRLD